MTSRLGTRGQAAQQTLVWKLTGAVKTNGPAVNLRLQLRVQQG